MPGKCRQTQNWDLFSHASIKQGRKNYDDIQRKESRGASVKSGSIARQTISKWRDVYDDILSKWRDVYDAERLYAIFVNASRVVC